MEEYLTRARLSYDNGENPEIGMTTPLLDFVNRTFLGQNTQCIEGPGGEGSGSIPMVEFKGKFLVPTFGGHRVL